MLPRHHSLVVLPCFFILSICLPFRYCSLNEAKISLNASSFDVGNSSENWRPSGRKLQKRYNLQNSGIKSSCHPIKEPICQTNLYNVTFFPNEWEYETPADAAAQLKKFYWILRSKCSPLLPIFVCLFFFPVCYEKPMVFPYSGEILILWKLPCAEMCESIRSECSPWLQRNGFDWPNILSCDKLPTRGDIEQECFVPVSNLLALQASKQALKNMADAGLVPQQAASHLGDHETVIDSGDTHGIKFSEENSHEMTVEEPANNLFLLIAMSVFISFLVLLSVSIGLVRCYIQVCAGTICSQRMKKQINHPKPGEQQPEINHQTNNCSKLLTRMRTPPVSKSANPVFIGEANVQDVRPSSEPSARKKRSWQPVDLEEQCKTISIYDVEDTALLANNDNNNNNTNRNDDIIYDKFADHQHILPSSRVRPSSSNHWIYPSHNNNEGRRPIPPPQSFSLGESLGQTARRPSVSWKRSSEMLAPDKGGEPVKDGNIVTSISMTFDKTAPADLLPESRNTLPRSPRSNLKTSQRQVRSRSQPELEKSPAPVWQQRQGAEQRETFEPGPSIRRIRKTITTATIGVGTSPSLAGRRPMVGTDKIVSVIERSLGNVHNYYNRPTAATSTSTNTLPAHTRPSRPRTKASNNIICTSDVNSSQNNQNNSNINNSVTLPNTKRASTPTKYSITLFLDEASRLNKATVNAPTTSTSEEESPLVRPPQSNTGPLSKSVIITQFSKSDQKKNSVSPKTVKETECPKHSTTGTGRELFYV